MKRTKPGVLILLSVLGTGPIFGQVGAGKLHAPVDLAELLAAAKSGSADSQLELALAFDEGKTVKRDASAAAHWYQEAANHGVGLADFELGVMAETGDGLPQDYGTARSHYQKAIALGVAAAQLRLGIMELEGWGSPANSENAVALITQAAEAGDHSAQKILSGMYFAGVGVPADLHTALRWAEEAAKVDDPEAESAIGSLVLRLHAQDDQTAREWYQLSAEQAYTQGMLGMAATFLRRGASRDQIEMGEKWLELAADNGDGVAAFYLAGLLLSPLYQAEPGSRAKAHTLLEQSFQSGQFQAGEALELASSGQSLAEAWRYVHSVPFARRYVQRFSSQRAAAEQDAARDHIPFPIKMVSPVYPMGFRLTKTEGNVTVDFIVDTTGRVRRARAVEASHPGFKNAAVLAVKSWRFMPGRKDGRIVNCHMRVPIYFRLTAIPIRENIPQQAQKEGNGF